MNFKKITAILLSAAMACTLTACGGSSDDEEDYVIENDTVYNIAVVRSEDNVYINMLDRGFIDCLTDKIGEEHLNISYIIYNEEDEKLLSEYQDALAAAEAAGQASEDGSVTIEATDSASQTDEADAADTEDTQDTPDTASEDGEEATAADKPHADDDAAAKSAEQATAEATQIAKSILPDLNTDDYNLIYTIGIPALQTVRTQTDTVPIVASGVVDYQNALGLKVPADEEWDSKTHTNVAGVQGLPPIDQQLSVMIEATPDLQAIGILYREDDMDAIYQNEVLESYLDQAGIPWKEYMIPAPVEETEEGAEVTEDGTEASDETADDESMTSDETAGDEAEEKADAGEADEVTSDEASDDERSFYDMIFGRRQDTDTGETTEGDSETAEGTEDTKGATAEETVRKPRQSALWDTYLNALLAVEAEEEKQQLAAEEAAQLEADAGAADTSDAKAVTEETAGEEAGETPVIKHPITELPEDAEESDIVEMASSVCDMLYVSAGSYLADDMETIGNVALEHNTRTFSGDTTGGKYTLVSLYCDPYNMGYQAGKLAYKILVEGNEAGELKLSSPSASAVQKLYNGQIAEAFGMTFPKSFMEITEFEETYVPGSMTTRDTGTDKN